MAQLSPTQEGAVGDAGSTVAARPARHLEVLAVVEQVGLLVAELLEVGIRGAVVAEVAILPLLLAEQAAPVLSS
jgi:hypothetical protein